MSKKKMIDGIINPFSQDFLETWELWKAYKMEEFKFKYKGLLSEQAGLMELNTLSASNEEDAKKIIFQSMAKKWKGLFELKNIKNGKSNSKEGFSRDEVNTILARKSYNNG